MKDIDLTHGISENRELIEVDGVIHYFDEVVLPDGESVYKVGVRESGTEDTFERVFSSLYEAENAFAELFLDDE